MTRVLRQQLEIVPEDVRARILLATHLAYDTQNADEAVRLANDTEYGLGASVITRDGEQAFPASSRDSYLRLIEAFADAVTSGRDPSPSGEDGLRSVELTAAIADSIRERRVVSLPAR